jgi:mRNA-capping enzyme
MLLFELNGAKTKTFISFASKGLAEKTHHFTLLDGEMIIDTLPDSKKQERRYLIYDLMAVNLVSVIEVRFICNCTI